MIEQAQSEATDSVWKNENEKQIKCDEHERIRNQKIDESFNYEIIKIDATISKYIEHKHKRTCEMFVLTVIYVDDYDHTFNWMKSEVQTEIVHIQFKKLM